MQPGNETAEICPPFDVPEGGSRHRALKRLRSWGRHKVRWRELRRECMSGRRLAELAAEGKARAYDLGPISYAFRAVLSANAFAALEWLYAAQRGFKRRGGVVVKHRDLARLLGRCERTAGNAMRELVAHGLVEVRWHFVELSYDERAAEIRAKLDAGRDVPTGAYHVRARKHREGTPAYRTTARCDAYVGRCFARGKQVGKNYQPAPNVDAALPPGEQGKGARARWPERAFVADVRACCPPAKAEAADVWVRGPGGERLRPPLSADALAQKLAREQRWRGGDPEVLDALLSSWRAFEARDAERGGGAGDAR